MAKKPIKNGQKEQKELFLASITTFCLPLHVQGLCDMDFILFLYCFTLALFSYFVGGGRNMKG